jgi:hypothetical protein
MLRISVRAAVETQTSRSLWELQLACRSIMSGCGVRDSFPIKTEITCQNEARFPSLRLFFICLFFCIWLSSGARSRSGAAAKGRTWKTEKSEAQGDFRGVSAAGKLFFAIGGQGVAIGIKLDAN